MRISSGYEDRRARIELIPMIDVVFLLLVFFIYAMLSMVVHHGLRVELPSGSTAQLDKREYVGVTITAENTILVDDRPVPLDGVVSAVQECRSGRADAPVFIGGDARADLGLTLQVLDRLRATGINEVMFEMEPDKR